MVTPILFIIKNYLVMRWTEEMDKIIAKSIFNHQKNRKLAFVQAQEEIISRFNIPISRKAISSRYYRCKTVIDGYVIDCALAKAFNPETPKKEEKLPWYINILRIFHINRKL